MRRERLGGSVTTLERVSAALERLLQAVAIVLILTLTAVVVVAVVYRKAGASLVWYDEVASVLLAWLTYYGAALAALKRAHIGFDGVVRALPPGWRFAAFILAEICVMAFFAVLAWTGWVVLQVLAGDTLVSLRWIPVRLTQSVIPVGAVLFMVCQAVSAPRQWRDLRHGNLESAGEGAR